MKNYHIHIYKVETKYEIDIEAKNEILAKEIALEMAKNNKLKECEKDCNYIALDFEI